MSNVLQMASKIIEESAKKINVVEIGTGYGTDLIEIYSKNLQKLSCIDPMYDWVPDVKPDEKFDQAKVDSKKVESWNKNSKELIKKGVKCNLIIGKSADIAVDEAKSKTLFNTNLLIIDGCHHPISAVEDDYWLYRKFMSKEHVVLFDDINHGDPGIAFENVKNKLEASGELVSYSLEGGYIGRLDVKMK